MFAHVDNLSFVTGDHLEKFPLVGAILKKFGAIVVDSCGGPEAREALSEERRPGRRRGAPHPDLSGGPPGQAGRAFPLPHRRLLHEQGFRPAVVPVATNLGCFWTQQEKKKTPGTATIEFLPALPQGLEKDEFMALMQATIEGRTNELVAQARGEPVRPSVLVEWDDKKNVAGTTIRAAEAST